MYWFKNILKYGIIKTIYFGYHKLVVQNKNKGMDLRLGFGCKLKNTEVGFRVYIGENSVLNNSSINDFSYVNSNVKIRDTKIGKFCSIGPNVKIVLGSHPLNFISTHPSFYSNNKPFVGFSNTMHFDEFKPVVIQNDVWIGEDVLIPGGIKIGNGAVVLARSVVTKDVEPYAIVGGVPAKVIKYRFDSETINKINKSEWWNWDEEKLNELSKTFLDPITFINNL